MPKTKPPNLNDFVTADDVADLIRRAREEDLGPQHIDVTSTMFVPADQMGKARIVTRKPGRLAGVVLLPAVVQIYGDTVKVKVHTQDGQPIQPGQAVATLSGPLQSILTVERVALNLITHLSGIASLTWQYVEQVKGTRAKVYDTRKTLPGLRGLQKYAVACGGGTTHRMGLYDAVLLKDNHLAHIDADGLGPKVTEACKRCRDKYPDLKFIMIEVDTLVQLEQVLPTGVDLVLLDNMTNEQLTEAVAMRDRLAPKVELEASGGINLQTIRGIAQTGVDRISVGALTHSAPALDLGLDIN